MFEPVRGFLQGLQRRFFAENGVSDYTAALQHNSSMNKPFPLELLWKIDRRILCNAKYPFSPRNLTLFVTAPGLIHPVPYGSKLEVRVFIVILRGLCLVFRLAHP